MSERPMSQPHILTENCWCNPTVEKVPAKPRQRCPVCHHLVADLSQHFHRGNAIGVAKG